jgi:hypothetical protein
MCRAGATRAFSSVEINGKTATLEVVLTKQKNNEADNGAGNRIRVVMTATA